MRGDSIFSPGVFAAQWRRNWPLLSFIALSLIVIVTVGLVANGLQQQIDRAEKTITNEKPLAVKAAAQIQSALGYEGFLGALQRFLIAPSPEAATVLEGFIRTANESIPTLAAAKADRLPVNVATWQAIVSIYQQHMARARAALAAGQTPDPALFTPLYASYQTLATLQGQLQAGVQASAWQELKHNNDALRHLVWLVLAASLLMVAASWLVLRGAYLQPLTALVRSLQGPGRLDKNMPVFGTSRADVIGEVAREVEALRQQLLNLPDMLVEGEGGAVPVKFGAAGQAVFQNLVGELTGAAAELRAANMPDTLQTIEQLCKALATTVAITHNDLKSATDNIRATSNSLYDVSQLQNNRLDDLVSALETRASTVAEIAKLTGVQVQTGLKDIVGAQVQMKIAAGQSSQLMSQYGGKIEDLSERMLAATNLLRASGKVLQETVDSVRTRMMDATSALTQTDARLTTVIEHNSARLAELAHQAETVLARGAQGHEALATLAGAADRIVQTAQRLESSEGSLGTAIQAMLKHSDIFAPLAEQLQRVHQQLSNQVSQQISDHVARQEAAINRLESQAGKLEGITQNLPTADLKMSLERLGDLAQLTDTLQPMLQQMQQLAPQLNSLGTLNLDGLSSLSSVLRESNAAGEANALKLNANLQLVQNQIADLLNGTAGEQAQLLVQVEAIYRTVNQIKLQRQGGWDEGQASASSQASAEQLQAMTSQLATTIDRQYTQFTGELAGFITRFEAALATPMTVNAEGEADVPATAKAILARLRGGDAPAVTSAPAQIGIKDAISRVGQIKQLTAALSRQTRNMTEIALGAEASTDPRALSQQAKELITEVMNAISDLSTAAETITEAADRLDARA